MYNSSRAGQTLKSRWILIYFQAMAHNAIIDGGTFKSSNEASYARAREVMNSKSPNEFRWSVRITGHVFDFYIGIASKLDPKSYFIGNYDEHAIIYAPHDGSIHKEKNQVSINASKAKSGEEIHFRFQPKLKKISLTLV